MPSSFLDFTMFLKKFRLLVSDTDSAWLSETRVAEEDRCAGGSENGHSESGIARTKLSFTSSSLSKLIVSGLEISRIRSS